MHVSKLLQLSSDLYEKKSTSRNALQLICRYWMMSTFSSDKSDSYLQKAYHVAVTAYNNDVANINLMFWVVFLNIEMREFDTAKDTLDRLNAHKGFFKQNDTYAYACVLYLGARFDMSTGNKRGVVKNSKLLEALTETIPQAYIFLASLGKPVSETRDYFIKAISSGNNSFFMFVELYKFVPSVFPETPSIEPLIVTLIRWMRAHGLDTKELAQKFMSVLQRSESIEADFLADVISDADSGLRSVNDIILKKICTDFVNKNDTTNRALGFYLWAFEMAIDIPGLGRSVVEAAYANDAKKLPIDIIERELRRTVVADIKSYLYHLLIIDKKESAYAREIIDFGNDSFAEARSGKYYNTIYAYILDFRFDARLSTEVFAGLFSVELTVPRDKAIKYVWVKEKEKRNLTIYPVKDGKTVFKAVSDDYTLYFLGDRQRNIIDTEYKANRLSNSYDDSFIRRLFQKGNIDINILVSLANHYLKEEYMSKDAIDLLMQVLRLPDISEYFQAKIGIALGLHYSRENQLERAFAYLKTIDTKYFESETDEIIKVFIAASEMKRAINLLVTKKNISDKAKFYAVKQIIKKENYKSYCANFAYELLLKSWYDKDLLDVVIKYYKGAQDKWIMLIEALNKIGVETAACCESIIQNCLFVGRYDDSLQRMFNNLYSYMADKGILSSAAINNFVYYTSAKIISGENASMLMLDTVKNLEEIFFRDEENAMLAYALSCIYIVQNIETQNTNYIMRSATKRMEEQSIMLQDIKKYQDKYFISSYIEKNMPFIYKAVPGKIIYIYYKESRDERFTKRRLRYYNFGMYIIVLPVFFGETLEYYFEEDGETTSHEKVSNDRARVVEQYRECFYKINNALIFEKNLKYDAVESIISKRLTEGKGFNLEIL